MSPAKKTGLMFNDELSHMTLCEWVLSGIEVTLREVIVNLLHGDTHVLQHLPQVLTCVLEHHGSVVRIVLLDQYVTIEAAHVLDTEGTDAAERAGSNRQNLALSDISTQLGVCC